MNCNRCLLEVSRCQTLCPRAQSPLSNKSWEETPCHRDKHSTSKEVCPPRPQHPYLFSLRKVPPQMITSRLLSEWDPHSQENSKKTWTSAALFKSPPIISPAQSLSILVQKSMRQNVKGTWMPTLTYVFGRVSHSITSMIWTLLRRTYMKTLPNRRSGVCLRVTMRQFWPMVRRELVRHTRWRVLSTLLGTRKEVSSPVPWRRSSGSSRCSPLKTVPLWLEPVTYRSITR